MTLASYHVHSAAMPSLACFVSPHGYGHAARACAVMERLAERLADLRFEVFSTVPRWFFVDSLGDRCGYHELACDLGLVQRSSLEEDIPATVAALDRLLPFVPDSLDRLAARLDALGCAAVLCDISPLGIAVGRRAGLPVVLVESFTWGWIYRHHRRSTPALRRHADRLDELLAEVDLRIQAEPTCEVVLGAPGVGPIARRVRSPAATVRERLGVDPDERLVLVSMGGVRWRYDGLGALGGARGTVFVVPGASEVVRREGAVLRLPHRAPLHHPDLVCAADLVIGKLGYSTVAEAVHAGCRFLYLRRPEFPESPVLEGFVRRRMTSALLDQASFDAGAWVSPAARLLAEKTPPRTAPPAAGAAAAADLILERCF